MAKTDDEDALTPAELEAAGAYAGRWVKEQLRDLVVERRHPDLAGLFYDIRADANVAASYLPTA